ncbi:MAG: TonB-dependent receptor [Myxococcaceae bacterium]|nr:TonB-dependent receptor [Myxococcaceae bacterium]
MPPKLSIVAAMLVTLALPALGQTPAALPMPPPPAGMKPIAQVAGDTAAAQQAQPSAANPDEAAVGDEAALDEELAEEGMGGPPKLPAGFTGITGRVVDAKSKEGIIEATVKVVSGAQKQVMTNLDGYYVLKLEPGIYDLRVFEGVYQGRRIQNVQVQEGKPTTLNVELSPDAGAVQEVVVEVRADRRSESALLQERKKAATVSDAISSQEIQRSPDSSAGDAVKRVVSATIVDGKYVLLRGLGGRYSQTLVNGALLASPEPDEPAVPLDIFPTSLLANLNVVKSYDPSLPGTFAGGALLIETNSYPTKFEFKPKLSLSGNSVTTFRARNDHIGGDGLPDAVPSSGPAIDLSREEETAAAKSFANRWSARQTQALPNGSIGASMGDTLRFGNSRLGYLVSANYSRAEQTRIAEIGRVNNNDGVLGYLEEGNVNLGTLTSSASGLANVGLQFNTDNELTVLALYTRGDDTQTQTGRAFTSQEFRWFDGTRLQHVTRALSFNQVRGFHRLGVLGDLELDWQANYSRVDRNEPDTRDISYFLEGRDDTSQGQFNQESNSGLRFFSDLAENSGGGSLNVTLPLSRLRVTLGGLAQVSGRKFSGRRFLFTLMEGTPAELQGLEPELLFAPGNIDQYVRLEERTQPQDGYNSFLGLYAGYLSADYKPVDALRLVGGVRYEASQLDLTGKSDYAISGAQGLNARTRYSDVLPTASVIWSLTPEVNLRAGYSYTLARPTFRELAPFRFYDFVRRRSVLGNEKLIETRIHNADLRAEWFVGENEVLAVSGFAKRFEDPIERVLLPDGESMTFANAQSADLYGAEVEARSTLGRLAEGLRNFRVGANLTLIRSRVQLRPEQVGSQTSARRPLQGQSPYVVNLNLGYERPESGTEFAVLYNVYGPRISEVGVMSNPDIYEQPFHRVDAVFSQQLGGSVQLKLSASNLLNSQIRLDQGGLTSLSYRPGIAVSAQLGMSL